MNNIRGELFDMVYSQIWNRVWSGVRDRVEYRDIKHIKFHIDNLVHNQININIGFQVN